MNEATTVLWMSRNSVPDLPQPSSCPISFCGDCTTSVAKHILHSLRSYFPICANLRKLFTCFELVERPNIILGLRKSRPALGMSQDLNRPACNSLTEGIGSGRLSMQLNLYRPPRGHIQCHLHQSALSNPVVRYMSEKPLSKPQNTGYPIGSWSLRPCISVLRLMILRPQMRQLSLMPG